MEAKSKDQQADYLLEAMRQLDEDAWYLIGAGYVKTAVID